MDDLVLNYDLRSLHGQNGFEGWVTVDEFRDLIVEDGWAVEDLLNRLNAQNDRAWNYITEVQLDLGIAPY